MGDRNGVASDGGVVLAEPQERAIDALLTFIPEARSVSGGAANAHWHECTEDEWRVVSRGLWRSDGDISIP
jgi:hypothetical protein